jgi:hypothetical protein
MSCHDVFGPPPEDATLLEKFDVELVGKTYGTLKLVNCVNIDIVNCTIQNLIIEESINIDVVESTFNGEGTAVTARKCMAVYVKGCKFTGEYEKLLVQSRSLNVKIE